MKARLSFLAILLLAVSALLSAPIDLEQGFRRVPHADKPWVYWWWLNGNVTEESITRDLEAMKRVGAGGLLMFDARGYHDDPEHVPAPPSRMDFMGPKWRRMMKFSLEKAAELDLKVSVNLSMCAGALKGPWDVGEDAPKKLVWAATELRGTKIDLSLTTPEGRHMEGIAVLAVRHDGEAAGLSDEWKELEAKAGLQPAITEVLDLTARVDASGRLVFKLPEGRWTLLRFGYATMVGDPAHHGQFVTSEDVDVLDPEAVERHFNRMGRALLEDAGLLAGKTLTHFYSVSWEGAIPTWTRVFEREFANRRGYAIRRWLPVLAGFTVKNAEESQRFRRDYYRTLGDCFRDNFYGKLHELCRRAGLQWHAESGGPWRLNLPSFAEADQLAFLARTDMPQGEFWWPRRSLNFPPAMTAHVYGKRLAAAEAFTHMQPHWAVYPANLKPRADAAFCDGINHLIWHTFTASPPELGLPGGEYFAGSHINPNVTWFPQAGPFFDYLGRSQFLLRQGRFVADVCFYLGDKPYLHWDQGGGGGPAGTVKLPAGHKCDVLTTEALLERVSVKDGDLILPDGMRYRALVVDLADEIVTLPALQKIAALTKGGARVVFGRRQPRRTPGLSGRSDRDAEVVRLAEKLWSGGKTNLEELLQTAAIPPDFSGPWPFTHRRTDVADIYFVAGTGEAECVFRVAGRQPELWDPVTGRVRNAGPWRATDDGRILVPLRLPENGSIFVVFRRAARKQRLVAEPRWEKAGLQLAGPWRVDFEVGRGAPKEAEFAELSAWNKHANPGIRHFSGEATYRKSFELTRAQAQGPVRLQLGEVKYIARVRLNGRDLGVVWTAPWSMELTSAVKSGSNELEIVVVNTWANRLIGDAALPKEERITRTNVALEPGKRRLRGFQSYAASDELMPSGLLGPVRVEFGSGGVSGR